jgi:alpha-beta hydrolase superfamily lysophospholipase
MIDFKKLYWDCIAIKNFLSVSKKLKNIPKKVFFNPSRMLDLDIYGDLKTANKIIILSHTGTANSDSPYNIYFAEQLYLAGYTVVAFNSQGYRNIITDEPFTAEKSSMAKLSIIIDNILDFIREENKTAPILAGAFSAGGFFLINHFTQNNRNVAGIVVHASFYSVESVYDDPSYILIFPTLDLQILYAKNFILSGKFKNLIKIYKAGFDWRRLYKINNNEDFCDDVHENKTNVPIVALHCKNDSVLSIKSAREFFKIMNSPYTKLIELSEVGHSLTDEVITTFIEQSDKLCNNWLVE